MRVLKTSEAAALLNVSPNTLRAWERRFAFPKPQRSAGKHRLFTYGEVAALRDALHEGLSISSAVSRAREGLSSDSHSLVGALVSFERDRADVAIEAALSLRSLERSVMEVLLPTLDGIAARHGTESAAWAFAASWGSEWLQRAQRLAPPPVRPASIVIGDASRDALDPDAPHIRALELFCLRAGVKVLSLSARGVVGVGEAAGLHHPDVIVLAGSHLDDDAIARWAYGVRLSVGALPLAVYRRAHQREPMRTTGATVLPVCAHAAQYRLLELIDARHLAHPEAPLRPARPLQPAGRHLRAATGTPDAG
ncbi:MAG: MerR family DNA-binding transcriptional regulator [Actinomycetota bacterium]|nr:MerR family DNA-binding transcriptional regulator [Actinomycetota bacterium]